MPAVEERLAYVEGRMTEQSQTFQDIRETMRRMEARLDSMEARMSNDFRWLVGIQITTLVAIIVALISRG